MWVAGFSFLWQIEFLSSFASPVPTQFLADTSFIIFSIPSHRKIAHNISYVYIRHGTASEIYVSLMSVEININMNGSR